MHLAGVPGICASSRRAGLKVGGWTGTPITAAQLRVLRMATTPMGGTHSHGSPGANLNSSRLCTGKRRLPIGMLLRMIGIVPQAVAWLRLVRYCGLSASGSQHCESPHRHPRRGVSIPTGMASAQPTGWYAHVAFHWPVWCRNSNLTVYKNEPPLRHRHRSHSPAVSSLSGSLLVRLDPRSICQRRQLPRSYHCRPNCQARQRARHQQSYRGL